MPVDGDSGIGVGTPVSPGPGTGLSIAQPLKVTLLDIHYYARIMGISPVHFAGATAGTVFPVTGGCSDVWPRYSWQNADRVSHEELARAIYDAEQDIARELGYYPAPVWIAQEQHRFPRHHRRDVYRRGGLNVRAQRASLRTRFAKFISSGRRNVTLIGTATTTGGSLAYTDEDGDGFNETATITLATTLTDECEIKAYFTGTGGDQAWEIRRPRSKTLTGGNIVLVFDSWLFINPDTLGAYPTSTGYSAIDISTVANYVTSVDVYREFNDFTQASATFFWEPTPSQLQIGSICTSCGGDGCAACSLVSQDGCLHVRDVENGIVVPQPATYSATDAAWAQDAYTECRDPDLVRLFYYAGDQGNRYLDGYSCEALSNYWAHAIAWMATARLERPVCGCVNVKTMFERLRQDLAHIGDTSQQLDPALLANPFGTRRGEVQAWQRVANIQGRGIKGGVI